MRRFSRLVLSLTLFGSLLVIQSGDAVHAAKAPLSCSVKKNHGTAFRYCTGRVTAKDGSVKLDTDVTLPLRGDGPFPVLVMLHGLGGSKFSFESRFPSDEAYDGAADTVAGTGGRFHYNNLWYASKGYAVLNYTVRGFLKSACIEKDTQSTDANVDLGYAPSPACLPQLVSIDHEVMDTQYLVGKLIDRTLISASDVSFNRRIGVTGVSYGGGHTWLLTRKNAWKSPKGARIKVAAAAPIIGWTDLVDALLPNGLIHNDNMPPTSLDDRMAEPTGVLKQSFVDAFFFLMGNTTSEQFVRPGYLSAWYTRVHGNEPYTDPVAQDAIHSLLSKRSAYYLPTPTFHTPIFAAQGFTDEIFPARQAEQMYARLKSEDPSYPIRLYVGDWGHPRSEADDGETHYLANAVMKWLNHYVKGAGSTPASRIDARTAVCGDAIGDLYRADTWADLSSGSMPLTLAGPQDLSTSADDPHRATIDPVNSSVIDRSSCRTTNTAVATGNVATTSDALATPFTMLGYPTVEMTAVPSAADMYVAAHLWDVAADGTTQTLVDRGVFRLGAASSQLVRFNLNGNGWTFDTGHKIKLELTAVDSPTFKASAATGTVSISGVTATVPQAAASKLVQ